MGPRELEEAPRPLTVRAFFGLPVPEAQREELGRFISVCAKIAPDFRWTPTENLHVTIRFLGSVDRTVAEVVADRVAGGRPAAFDLELGDIGTFGRSRSVRVVWVGLRAGAGGAGALARGVEAECLGAGLPGEERSFQAHLTLARARPRFGGTLPELPATPQLDPWRAEELILYSSRITRAGAIYEAMRTLPLG